VTAIFNAIQLTAPLVSSIGLGQRSQGQVQALGLNYYIAISGVFPSQGSLNDTGTPYIGQIMQFAGGFAPNGWRLCDGSLLSIAQNQALFSIVGTMYGGNGVTNFAIPDLRARAPMGMGTLTGGTIPASSPGVSVVPTISSVTRGGVSQGQIHALGVNYLIATSAPFPGREGAINASNSVLGQIMIFAGNFAPMGWSFCDGSVLTIQSNTALFSILGTSFGGNGTTTFALPDLRGRIPMGVGALTSPVLPPSSSTQVPIITSITQGQAAQGQTGALGVNYAIAMSGTYPGQGGGGINSNGPMYGQVMMFGGNFAPAGWATCDGTLKDISANEALFSLLGTDFGGNGTSNFALPNLSSRVPMGAGSR
jgi:microcystin-dependent protein